MWYLRLYKLALRLKSHLWISSLKKPLRNEITEEGKDKGLMALDKKDNSGMGKILPNI